MSSKRRGRRSGRATSDADSSGSSDDDSDSEYDSSTSTDDDKDRGRRRHRGRSKRRHGRRRQGDAGSEDSASTSATTDDSDSGSRSEDSSSDDRRRDRRHSRHSHGKRRSSSSSSHRRRKRRRGRGDVTSSDSDSRSYSTSPSRSIEGEEASASSDTSQTDSYDDRVDQHADAELAPRAKGDIGTIVIVPSANIFHQFCKDTSVFLSHFMTQSIDSYEQKHRVSRESAILAFVRIIVAPVSNLSEGVFDEIFKRCVAPTGSDDEARNACSHFMSSLQYAAANFIYPDSPSLQIARDVRYGSGGAGVTKTRIQGSRFNTQALGRKTGHIGFVFECSANRQAFTHSSPPCLDIEVFLIGCLSHFVKRNVLINNGDSLNTPSPSSSSSSSRQAKSGRKQQTPAVGVNMIYFDLSSYQMLTELMAASVKDNLCTVAKETTSEAYIWRKHANFANNPFCVATMRFMGVNAQANEDRRAVAAKLSHKVQDTLDRMATDLSSQKRHLKRELVSHQQDLKGIMKKAAKDAKKLQLQKAAEQIIRKDKKRRESQRKRKKRKAAEYARKRKAAANAKKNTSNSNNGSDNINVKVGGNTRGGDKSKTQKEDGNKRKSKRKRKHKKHSSSSASGDSSDDSSSDSLSSSSSLFSSSD